jgi:hypothetical protein
VADRVVTYADTEHDAAKGYLYGAALVGAVELWLWVAGIHWLDFVLRVALVFACIRCAYHAGRADGWRTHERERV